MADITEYENTNPENINEAFENLSGDVNYMVHKMKEFNKEVIELFSDMKELKEFVDLDMKSLDKYNIARKAYIDLYYKFDDLRNYYDNSRN
jgi:ABC-type transporter lipoprotein component MlaA